MFIDTAKITVKAGKGGDGLSSFRHERYIAKGGPDGGDGGNGGNVIAMADHNLHTLSKFRYSKLIKAEDGERGKPRKQHGRNGEDIIIKVPLGTVVMQGDQVVADLTEQDQTVVIAKGGRGGFGNAHFTSSTRQAPTMAELGEKGDERELVLELKTVADLGLVGLPNAGKSTLLSVVSNAKPEIADYPFTTLVPNLGVANIYDESLIIADIPGLIEGASEGKGLGDDFLRHIERTSVILHLIAATSPDVVMDYETINHELKGYEADLTNKPQLVVLTKSDAVEEKLLKKAQKSLQNHIKDEVFVISAVAHKGIEDVLAKALELVKADRAKEPEEVEEAIPHLTLEDDPNAWWIEEKNGKYTVHGQKIEGFARRSDFTSAEAVARLRDIMKKQGIARELGRMGLKPGAKITIASKKLEW